MFLRIVLVSFILGGVFRLTDYRAWLSLRNYTVKAESPVLEQRLWDVLPSRCFSFWPQLYFDADGLTEYLERDMPASVTTTMVSMGNFVTVMRWRTPWIRVQWRGDVWCISRDGYMWNTAKLPKIYARDLEKTGPIWHLAQLSEEGPAPSGVIKSIVPTGAIRDFMEAFEHCLWFKMIKSVTMDRRAGAELFRLSLENNQNQHFEILIQREKYAGQDLGVTIEQVLTRLVREGGNHLIDATYEGKILLQTLPDGSKEGMK